MEESKKQEEFKNALTTAMTKAWDDDVFKQQLIQNPIETIKDLTGIELHLKKGTELIISDQSNLKACYINIPVKPSLEDMELNEEQLEMVAGGLNPIEKLQVKIAEKIIEFLY